MMAKQQIQDLIHSSYLYIEAPVRKWLTSACTHVDINKYNLNKYTKQKHKRSRQLGLRRTHTRLAPPHKQSQLYDLL